MSRSGELMNYQSICSECEEEKLFVYHDGHGKVIRTVCSACGEMEDVKEQSDE